MSFHSEDEVFMPIVNWQNMNQS